MSVAMATQAPRFCVSFTPELLRPERMDYRQSFASVSSALSPVRLHSPPSYYVTDQRSKKLSREDDFLQNSCLRLMQQMGNVLRTADETFASLTRDVEQVMGRSSKLSQRVARLAAFVAKLDHRKPHALRPAPPRIRKEDISLPHVFVPGTRPPTVRELYAACQPRVPTVDVAVQTAAAGGSSKVNGLSRRPSIKKKQEKAPNLAFDVASSSEGDAIYENVSVLVPIDISGAPLRRLASERRSLPSSARSRPPLRRSNSVRKTTENLPGDTLPRHNGKRLVFTSKIQDILEEPPPVPKHQQQASEHSSDYAANPASKPKRRPRKDRRATIGGPADDRPEIDISRLQQRAKDDCVIRPEIMPHSKSETFAKQPRQESNFLSNVKNQFATLRRKTRRKVRNIDSPLYENLYDLSLQNDPTECQIYENCRTRSTDEAGESDYSGYNASNSVSHGSSRSSPSEPEPKTFKNLFRRTLSLRLPKRNKEDELYSAISIRPKTTPKNVPEPPPVPPKKRSALPLRQSQMAANIHRNQNRFTRKSSTVPDSDWSASGFESRSQSSYREGFRLEYPTECKASPFVLRKTQQFKRSCESSLGEDSNFSCDLDGYFTSMHKDSGLWDYGKIEEFIDFSINRLGLSPSNTEQRPRSGSVSSHASTGTVQKSSDSDEVFEPAKLRENVSPDDAFPPICTVSGGDSDEEPMDATLRDGLPSPLPTFSPRWGPSDGAFPKFGSMPQPKFSSSPHKPETKNGTGQRSSFTFQVATVRPHQHNGKVIVGSAEIPEKDFDSWLLAKFKSEMDKNPALRDLNGNSHHTMPRKTVRFCE